MSDFLDHAITVRDALYVSFGLFFVFVLPLLGIAIYLIASSRKVDALGRKRHAAHKDEQIPTNGQRYNIRNPAYGIPKSGIKWENGRPYTID